MLVAILLFVVGLLLLSYSVDRLIFGAAILARTVGIPPYAIGLTIVNIGISLPAVTIALNAAMYQQMDLVAGLAIGSHVTNVLLILGCALLIRPIHITSDILRRELTLLLCLVLLLGGLLYNNKLDRSDGVILLLLFFAFIWLVLKIAYLAQKEGRDTLTIEQTAELPPRNSSYAIALLWIIIGLIILPLTAKMVLDNAVVIARYLEISDLVMGASLIALGTCLPLLVATLAGIVKNEQDMVIGYITGANIFTIMLAVGLSALIAPGALSPYVFQRYYWIILLVNLILVLLCLKKKQPVSSWIGGMLICAFGIYIIILFI